VPWVEDAPVGLRPLDSGHESSDSAFWEFFVPLQVDSAATALIWGVPPANPKAFDGRAYALTTPIDTMLKSVATTDATYRESALSFMLPVQPTRLDAVKKRGSKVMVYHGVTTCSPHWSAGSRTGERRTASSPEPEARATRSARTATYPPPGRPIALVPLSLPQGSAPRGRCRRSPVGGQLPL
jgi:hypothetical protein